MPFDNSIRGNGKIVNRKNSLSNQTDSGDIAPLPGNVYGKDIALETAKKLFADAYRKGGKNTLKDGEVNYSVTEIIDDNGNNFGIGVRLDSDLLAGLTDSERKQMVRMRIVEELAGNSFIAYDNGVPVEISIAKRNEKFKTDSGRMKPVVKELYNKYIGNEIKQEAVVLADELIEASVADEPSPAKHAHGWLDNYGKNDWDNRKVYLQDKNNTVWEATLHIANSTDGRKILYDIDPIKKTEGPRTSSPTTINTNIAQQDENVNHNSDQDYMDAVVLQLM